MGKLIEELVESNISWYTEISLIVWCNVETKEKIVDEEIQKFVKCQKNIETRKISKPEKLKLEISETEKSQISIVESCLARVRFQILSSRTDKRQTAPSISI